MTEKITDEELVDLLEALKRAHGMGVCSKAVISVAGVALPCGAKPD
ncbi:TPA: hypothetical protein ACX289_004071 [Escherichia coli]